MVRTCRFDEGLKDEVQTAKDGDKSATVLRPDAIELEEIMEHVSVTL